jgi:hypothetical protein
MRSKKPKKDEAPRGFHRHKCDCGHVWQHSDLCAGSIEAHVCPSCDSTVTWRCMSDEPLTNLETKNGSQKVRRTRS